MLNVLFAKNGTETSEPVKANVEGTLPDWLQGTLLRNGPGMFSVGDTAYNHWFDGMALIHSFTFKDGEVYYRSKYLNSDTYKKNMTANRIVVSEFGTMVYPDPCKSIFSRAFTYLTSIIPDFTDNNLINIIRYGEDYYASSEINYINQLDLETLDTVRRVNYRNYIAVNLATAHPHYDDQGNTYNLGTSMMSLTGPKYVIFKVPCHASADKEKKKLALKKAKPVGTVPCRSRMYPSYFHSFGLTENYIVFVEQSYKLDILKLATAYYRGINWGSCLKFDKDDTTLIHLINRTTGKTVSTKYYTDALVVFHHINAYEDEGHVVFDMITYRDGNLYNMMYLKNMQQNIEEFMEAHKMSSPPTCQRFVLPLDLDRDAPDGTNQVKLTDTTATAVVQKDGAVYCQPDTLFQGLELPGINYKFNARKYRYFYGTRVEWTASPNKIGKIDIVTRKCLEWTEEEYYPSEPVFVASPDAVEEDDGVILSSVISTNPEKSPFMLVLNAKNFEELARARLSTSVHLDLHGLFIPRQDSTKSDQQGA